MTLEVSPLMKIRKGFMAATGRLFILRERSLPNGHICHHFRRWISYGKTACPGERSSDG